MRKPILLAVVFAVFLLAGRVISQETSKGQSAKPLAGYTVLVVERFKVEPTAVKAGFVEARAPVMQSEIILQLVKKKIFEEVIDSSISPSTPSDEQPPPENSKRQLLLSGTVTDFVPGSQAEQLSPWVRCRGCQVKNALRVSGCRHRKGDFVHGPSAQILDGSFWRQQECGNNSHCRGNGQVNC